MRIRYRVPFKRKILIDDHWDIPMQGGKLRVIEKNHHAEALEIIFEHQPIEYAPSVRKHTEGEIVATITGRDHRMTSVKHQLDNAITFLECFHDVELMTDEMEVSYEGETPEEDAKIVIKGSSFGRSSQTLPLSFDMITRALMAAEHHDGPRFEATLVGSARKALARQEFINSFRYSFLLIESLFGDGQFKKASLQIALKASKEFRSIVEFAIKDVIPTKDDRSSDTTTMLAAKPTADEVIDHLIEKRGFYFHGNVKRKDAWRPDEQGAAESLAHLAAAIATRISMKAADPIFELDLEKRHYEHAMQAGAKIVFDIKFKFREPAEDFDRQNNININIAGTKVTARTSFAVAQHFLKVFQEHQPASHLLEARCIVQGSDQKVFDLTFYSPEERAK
ncbi:hypothetical protein HP062_14405 [Pseudomonas sp. B14-6]|uniref:hypothetical protein n=1 Tax=Pseudomonas sp. B14-6 TaxID=2738843 RepID=UPI00155EA42B|nr:hypothetical protein [Pseudomonas sp. B14-6]QKG66675.1 hypothetical protein HP062_14405 [Pseudomonas sp. B14-6]